MAADFFFDLTGRGLALRFAATCIARGALLPIWTRSGACTRRAPPKLCAGRMVAASSGVTHRDVRMRFFIELLVQTWMKNYLLDEMWKRSQRLASIRELPNS